MQKNPETVWIKESPMMGFATGPRPPMEKKHRNALRVPRLLNPKRLSISNELKRPTWPHLFKE